MTDLIVIAIVIVIVGSALGYIIRAKKRGVKCIGCPAGGNCTSCPSSGETAGNCCGQTHTCGCCAEQKSPSVVCFLSIQMQEARSNMLRASCHTR